MFVKSVSRATHLNKLLNDEKFPSIVTHSRMDQAKRIEKYQQFKNFGSRILVATNLFGSSHLLTLSLRFLLFSGRGVDFERVNVVINYDMPENEDTYLHRVG